MSKLFLTDPDNQSDEVKQRTKKPTGNRSIRYKEHVCSALQTLGIPKQTAEVAVIDLRGMLITSMHKKFTSFEAATNLLPSINKIYKNEDGSFHYM